MKLIHKYNNIDVFLFNSEEVPTFYSSLKIGDLLFVRYPFAYNSSYEEFEKNIEIINSPNVDVFNLVEYVYLITSNIKIEKFYDFKDVFIFNDIILINDFYDVSTKNKFKKIKNYKLTFQTTSRGLLAGVLRSKNNL